MDGQLAQTVAVVAIVAGAALYLGFRWRRTVAAARREDDGCGGDCGCGPK